MAHPKNQHYVPQFILRNFTFDGTHLYCYDKKTGKSFAPNTENVASETYFNDFENGVAESSLEYPLTEAEDKCAPAITRLVLERDLRSLSPTERANISFYTALQILRTRNVREEFLHMNKEISRMLREQGANPNLVRNFHEFKSEQEVKEVALSNLANATELAPYVLNKRWTLCTSDQKFLTSDNPIARQNTVNRDSLRGTLGLANKGVEVYFPLSPSVLLCFLCEETFLETQQKYERNRVDLDRRGLFETRNFVNSIRRRIPIEYTDENVENVNSLQVIHAERFLFSVKNDFGLAIDMISEDAKLKGGPRSKIG